MVKSSKKKFSKFKQHQTDFSLQDVLERGGTEEDYNLVKDVENDGKNVQHHKSENIQNDVAGFLNELKKEEKKELKKNKNVKDLKKKKPRWRNRIDKGIPGTKQTTFSPTVSDDMVTLPISNVFGNLEMPTQQLVMSYLSWHDVLTSDPQGKVDTSFQFINDLKHYATMLLQKETKFYQENSKAGRRDGNSHWVKTAASTGTTRDRVAALSVLCQEAPLHNFKSFEALINMTKRDIKRETLQGIEAIKNLLLKGLLPKERRLRFFHQHPLDKVYSALMSDSNDTENWSLETCQKFLILWNYEDRLKHLVAEFISLLSNLSRDPLSASKRKAMDVAFNLLKRKPEGERELLGLLVNKLGDPTKTPATHALHLLNKLSDDNPMMLTVIVKAVRDLLLTPKLATRTQYYCICFLSAQLLSPDRKDIADNLIKIYMNFFKSLVNKNDEREEESHNKMMAALLSGVHRALPFAEINEDVLNEINGLYKASHHSKMSTVVRALSILFQVLEVRHENADRFYNTLYSTLFHPELPTSLARQPMFMNVLFRALKFDSCDARRDAFVKRCLHVTTLCQPAFIAAFLTMISELMKEKPVFAQRLLHTPTSSNKNEDEKMSAFKDDDEEEHFYDVDKGKEAQERSGDDSKKVTSSWVHKKEEGKESSVKDYNPLYRNPRYCGVEQAAFWELHVLTRHFHPTVALYAQSLITPSEENPFMGDPLSDYTLIKFLDRFVYRNPKATKEEEGYTGRRVRYFHHHSRTRFVEKKIVRDIIPANNPLFLKKKDFRPEEVFFQKYFSLPSVQSRQRRKRRGKDKGEKEEELHELSDGEFEKFINNAEGEKEAEKNLRFYDHVSKSGPVKSDKGRDLDLSDEEDEATWDGMGDDNSQMDEEEGEDARSSGGVFITGGNATKKRKGKAVKPMKKKKMKMIGNELGDMLAETAMDEFDTITSGATIVKDAPSAKQMRWEKKRELKDVLQKKREWKQRNAGQRGAKARKRKGT